MSTLKKNRVQNMGGKCCEKNRVPTILGLSFFPALKKKSKKCLDSVFSQHIPPISGTLLFSELKCLDSSLRHFLLCTGSRVLVIAS